MTKVTAWTPASYRAKSGLLVGRHADARRTTIRHKDLQMSVEDVAGAAWESETTWPSKRFAEKVRAESDEISTNVYRVRLGTGQHSFIF